MSRKQSCKSGGHRPTGYGEKFIRQPSDNDANWYAAYPELLRDAASIAFPYAVGSPFKFHGLEEINNPHVVNRAQPGFFKIRYRTAPGICVDATSPFNVASTLMYSHVRHKNSGSANYDPPDLMLYIIAMENMYSWYAELCRAYGVMRTFSLKNKYMPKYYMTALGFDIDDLSTKMSDFRYYIGYLAARLNHFAVPGSSTYLARHIWMNSHLFADDPGSRFQTYAYVPEGYYGYDELYERGGRLVFKAKPSDCMTLDQIRDYTRSLFDPLVASEDIGIISGDIMKAWDSNLVTLSSIAEEYTVVPEYNLEVLTQIHNTRFTGPVLPNEYQDIYQDPDKGILIYKPEVQHTECMDMENVIDTILESPDPGIVMVATRNQAVMSDANGLESVGSDYCTGGTIYYLQYSDDGELELGTHEVRSIYSYSLSETDADITSDQMASMIEIISGSTYLEHFNFHPYVMYTFKVGEERFATGRYGDTTNSTIVSNDTLKKMHETALMSQFNVPGMGAFTASK